MPPTENSASKVGIWTAFLILAVCEHVRRGVVRVRHIGDFFCREPEAR